MSEASAVTRRRSPKGDRTRIAILEAALEVFAQHGYRSGSLRDIADRVQLTEQAVLHHFRSKSALLEAVLLYRDKQSYAYAPLDREDGEDAIRGLVELVRHNASVPGVIELYTTLAAEALSPDHPAHGYFERRYRTVRSILTRSFERLEADGMLRPGVHPDWAADATTALMDGLQTQWLMAPGSVDMTERLVQFLELITSIAIVERDDAEPA